MPASSGPRTVIYPVRDLAAAKAVFTALLDRAPSTDAPYYVGWSLEGDDVGLDPNGHAAGLTGPTPYWHVPDIDRTVAMLTSAGAVLTQPVREVGGSRKVANLADADGNPIGLIQD